MGLHGRAHAVGAAARGRHRSGSRCATSTTCASFAAYELNAYTVLLGGRRWCSPRPRSARRGGVRVVKHLSQVLQRPVITETRPALRERNNKYMFEVAPAANKHEIRQAVEHFFGVKVVDVRTMNRPGKPKRLGRFEGERAALEEGRRDAGRRRQDRSVRPDLIGSTAAAAAAQTRRGVEQDGDQEAEARHAWPALPHGFRLRRDHRGDAGEVAARADEEVPAGATTPGASRRASAAAGTSAATA